MIVTGRSLVVLETATGWRLNVVRHIKHHGGGISDEVTDIIESEDPEVIVNAMIIHGTPQKFLLEVNARRKAKNQRLVK